MVLQRDGSQNNGWHEAQMSLMSEVRFRLVIETTRGSGEAGDTAVDDISFHEGHCGNVCYYLFGVVFTAGGGGGWKLVCDCFF